MANDADVIRAEGLGNPLRENRASRQGISDDLLTPQFRGR
jgi:hypothetical protein